MTPHVQRPDTSEFQVLLETVRTGWSPKTGEWRCEQMTQHLLSHPDGARVLSLGGKPLSLVFFQSLPKVIEILFLLTLPSARGQGFMGYLLNSLFEEFRDCDFWLEVREDNLAARALYKKLRFFESGRRPQYYSDGATALLLSRSSSLSLK